MKGLDLLPGVSTISTGTGIGKPVIRGLRGNRVLVYSKDYVLKINNLEMNMVWVLMNLVLKVLEVIKGPASLIIWF